jgi:pimeloyl-ACP methyl ester carboxylesterase
MLLHATGFHGRCWLQAAPVLARDFTVWAIDQRGHGASGKGDLGGLGDWSVFVDDLLAVLEILDENPGSRWYGLGHSLGGTVLLLGEARRPGTFRRLCCYEPVVYDPATFADYGTGAVSLGDLARKRRTGFATRRDALHNYRSKPPFNRFDPATLEAYVDYGLVDAGDGSVTLACRREDEGSVFDGAPSSGGLAGLDQVDAPVTVLAGADMSDPVSKVADVVAATLPRAALARLQGLDHFGPLTHPQRVAGEAAAALAPVGHRSPRAVTPPG